MAAIAEVGAKDSKKPENEKGKVTIYLGIFFDGTNNHRLQVLLGKNYRGKNGLGNTLNDEERKIAKKFKLDIDQYDDNNQLKDNGEISALQREKSTLEKALRSNDESDYFLNIYRLNRLDSVTKDLELEVSKFKYDETIYKDHAIQTNDFTNIAILESFYRAKNKDLSDNEYAYKIYVSGSGVTRDLTDIGDWRGAGFGQGSTGVVQKVSDAMSCVNRKLALFSNVEDKNITLIFHLFGFSRGATEARIFAHVINKQKNERRGGHQKSFYLSPVGALTDSELQELTPEQRNTYLKLRKKLIDKHDYQNFKFEDSMKISREMSKDRETSQAGGLFAIVKIIEDLIAENKYKEGLRQLDKAAREDIQRNKMGNIGSEKSAVVRKQNQDQDKVNNLWTYVFKGQDKIKNIIKKGIVSIPAMGIYDTVSSVGVLFKNAIGNKTLIDVENSISTWSKFHHKNVEDLGLNDLGLVDDVYHICALDEYRENFALVPVSKSSATSVTQIYIPGCHADVGGGYSDGYDKKVSFKEDSFYIPYEAKPDHLRNEPNLEGFTFNIHNLKETMWFCEKKKNPDLNVSDLFDRISNVVSIYRYSKKGYSYVGLHLMANKFKSLFNLEDKNFCVPVDLSDIYKGAESTGNDQCFYPDPERYRLLRKDYLHLSMDDGLVNKPNFILINEDDNKAIKFLSRIEYTEEYCEKVEKEYQNYQIKRLETIENHYNQML